MEKKDLNPSKQLLFQIAVNPKEEIIISLKISFSNSFPSNDILSEIKSFKWFIFFILTLLFLLNELNFFEFHL